MYLEMAKVVVDSTTMRGAQFGINENPGTTLSLSNSIIEDASLYGILVGDSRIEVTSTSFDGNDTGLALASGTSWVEGIVRNCTFTNNGDGIWVDNVGDSSVVIDDCVIDDNTTSGIFIEDGGDVAITRNTITNNAIGVYSYGSNPAIRSRNVIQYNEAGIKCDSYSTAAVESCTVNNNTNGVHVVNGANPDLGHESGGSSSGQNIMRPNTTYHVLNLTSNGIVAENNYWPRNPPTRPRRSWPRR
jgi:parallel beta-helix repeat protein